MRTDSKRSPLASIPSYSKNAVVQLIIASGTGFISFKLIYVIVRIAGFSDDYFFSNFTFNVALPSVHNFGAKWWTIFTYGWTHNGFWELFTNMVWLWGFGSVIQGLVSYKQLIPLFVYSLIIGGLSFELCQLIPGADYASGGYFLGAQAGIIGVAVGAITLSPNYRYYLTPTFSIPLVVLFVIFMALILVGTGLHAPMLFLLGGGALTGFVYITLLKNGYQPGMWVYNIFGKLDNMVTPDEAALMRKQNKKRNSVIDNVNSKQHIAQRRIDEILDKINQKGYESLTKEEKELLLKASREKDT
ncbi:MAG: rhomboid family intramembrane serine protease [Bacteroidetes bacterium]|nr:rhomboid family intramembrane serine protease [Bacteroidota bacterium]